MAWLSLDEDDNDPARFLSYLVAAVGRSTRDERFAEGVLAALRSPEPPRIDDLLAGAAVLFVFSIGYPRITAMRRSAENPEGPRPTASRDVTRPRMLTRPLVLVFASSFGFSTSFYLLLSVVPLYAASVGAGGRRSPWRGIWWTGLMTAVRHERSGVYLLLLYQSLNNRRLR